MKAQSPTELPASLRDRVAVRARHWAAPEPLTNSDEMKLPPGFAARLAEKSDEQLCQILAEAPVYLPEALEAARAELRRRKLTLERVAEIQIATRAKLAEERRAEEESRRRAGRCHHLLLFLFHCIFRS